ncbi:galactose-binding domain-containing protein [Microlunatus endophyticus]|nr:discoidin domain-containing protein [Microlunatus endophyticus]
MPLIEEQTVSDSLALGRRVVAKFPDLRFLNPGGELELKMRIPAATAVRIELPSTESLHLATVLIDADGVTDLVAATSRTTSSSWKDYDKTLASGILFDPGNRETAMHTRKEWQPWMQISFTDPVEISRIFIRNRDDGTSVRARGLQVLVQNDHGRWTTVYDGIRREREFAAAMNRAYGGLTARLDPVIGRLPAWIRPDLHRGAPAGILASKPQTNRLGGDLVRILTALYLRDYTGVARDSDLLDMSADQAAHFRALVNSNILAERELEWTSHGIRRSFRFWPRVEQEQYVSFAMGVVEALRDLNDCVCLGFGSVLAVVRDHTLIPHDDDLDILIGFTQDQASSLADGIALVRQCLIPKGYSVTGNLTAHQWVTKSGSSHKVDVFVGLFEGQAISWYPGKRGSLTREMMFPAKSMQFLGTECVVPREPEQYLEQVYGSTWSIPDSNFRHQWVRSEYADIAK